MCFFFFQAEDGIRDLVRSRGLGDVYKRQGQDRVAVRLRQGAEARHLAAQTIALGRGDEGAQLSLIHI
mgnify:CR=1 FL=1